MTGPSTPDPGVARRSVLKSGVAGALATGGLLATGSASGRQGGVAYLKEGQLRGKNSPDEPTFRVIEACWTDEVALPCDGTGERRYTAYKIRCPNYPGGGGGNNGGHDDGHTEAGSERYDTDHEGGDCPGRDNGEGGCGRQMLVNPNRDLRTGHLHVFTAVQDCGDGYVRAAFGPA